jgi:UV DNA damage endonuclease
LRVLIYSVIILSSHKDSKMTVHHTLVCLLNDKNIGFKTCRLSSSPSIEKIREVYKHNIHTLVTILNFCRKNNIDSYRISSGLFPLLTHPNYHDKLFAMMNNEILPMVSKINFSGIHLSCHPDQFILLSSLNENVIQNSSFELNMWGYISHFIPIDLVNIHVGTKQKGIEYHTDIFMNAFQKLDKHTQSLISLENDEKSYCFLETLTLAKKAGCMMVPDFHHERCFQKRVNGELTNQECDKVIYDNIEEVFSTYHTKALPTFHISSPKNGWVDSFKNNCSHADYIDMNDYPIHLHSFNTEVRLDVEAKFKNDAIYRIVEEIKLL